MPRHRRRRRANKDRDLSQFILYAVQGYHDGLRQIIEAVENSMFDVAWKFLVYRRFSDYRHRKRDVFRRQRTLALSIPPGPGVTINELSLVTPELARDYAGLSARTLLRDLAVLKEMELVVQDRDRYRLNFDLLVPHIAQRRHTRSAT